MNYILPSTLNSGWIHEFHPKFLRLLQKEDLILDCKDLESLNAIEKAFFSDLNIQAQKTDHILQLQNLKKEFQIQLSKGALPLPPLETSNQEGTIESIGSLYYSFKNEFLQTLLMLSESLYASTIGLWKKRTVLPGSLILQMNILGSNAVAIVLMLSFLIGLTLAFQSAVQLEQFGASIYLAGGVGISMITEIGPLMTAIILAGRSGSAVTAELATMTVQEEVKALKTMGVHPLHFLVLPRFQAMSLVMPLLVAASQLTGIFAGLLVGVFYSKLPAGLFLSELAEAISPTMLWQSHLKGEVFAWLIILIASRRGLAVTGGADAVGRATTQCVVASISAIILADAAFSFLFYW